MISDAAILAFRKTVWRYYQQSGRHDLPWRSNDFDPYKIMVSELMLQQTQVSRVMPKYEAFVAHFPTVQVLAKAPQADVLRAWSGLGYNRRARYLHQVAQMIVADFDGQFPHATAQLAKLPGIGPNTAGAIVTYAFNQPVVFIETNIRTVFIHHFFNDQDRIADAAIQQLVDQTLDREQPREWYWALMDYGSSLKRNVGNPNRRSRSYTRQSAFHGSRRQIRGQVIHLLGSAPRRFEDLAALIDDERLTDVLDALVSEGLIRLRGQYFRL